MMLNCLLTLFPPQCYDKQLLTLRPPSSYHMCHKTQCQTTEKLISTRHNIFIVFVFILLKNSPIVKLLVGKKDFYFWLKKKTHTHASYSFYFWPKKNVNFWCTLMLTQIALTLSNHPASSHNVLESKNLTSY